MKNRYKFVIWVLLITLIPITTWLIYLHTLKLEKHRIEQLLIDTQSVKCYFACGQYCNPDVKDMTEEEFDNLLAKTKKFWGITIKQPERKCEYPYGCECYNRQLHIYYYRHYYYYCNKYYADNAECECDICADEEKITCTCLNADPLNKLIESLKYLENDEIGSIRSHIWLLWSRFFRTRE